MRALTDTMAGGSPSFERANAKTATGDRGNYKANEARPQSSRQESTALLNFIEFEKSNLDLLNEFIISMNQCQKA